MKCIRMLTCQLGFGFLFILAITACSTHEDTQFGNANVVYLIPKNEKLLETGARPELIFDQQRQAEYQLEILVTSDWELTNRGILDGQIKAVIVHHAAIGSIDTNQIENYFDARCLSIMMIGSHEQVNSLAEQLTGNTTSKALLNNAEPGLVAFWRTELKNTRSAGFISLERESSLALTAIRGELDRKDPADPCQAADHTPDARLEATRNAFLESEGIILTPENN